MMKITEICRRLNVSRQTVLRLIADGKLVAVRVGSQWRVSEEAYNAYLKQHSSS